MSSSPAWLTIALTHLAATPNPPSPVLASGIRTLPAPHTLHHLNRWARHVWRPAVPARALSSLTATPDERQLSDLGSGAVSLLSALVDAVERCGAEPWLGVLGVMFLADDPWAVEVGRAGAAAATDRAVAVMQALYREQRTMLADVAARLSLDVRDVADDIDLDASVHGESIAELRCRTAALQLQLDDVTAVVRRNEKNTKDLLSSFHFWSMLLLDELRSYKSQLGERGGAGNSRNAPPASEEVLDAFSRAVNIGSASASDRSPEGGSQEGDAKPEAPKPKRVFRDGKWVTL